MLQDHVSKTKTKSPKVHRVSWSSGGGKNAETEERLE